MTTAPSSPSIASTPVKLDALRAWEEYQATGLHLTGEEVDAWLARLEAGEDIDPPAPHF